MAKNKRSRAGGFCKKANKEILADRIQAELVLEAIQLRSRREIHTESRSYPCLFGNHWHLTSEKQRTENNRLPHSA